MVLPIASVALAARSLRVGLLPPVGCERFANVVRFFELTPGVAPDVPLVGPRIDQLAFRRAPRGSGFPSRICHEHASGSSYATEKPRDSRRVSRARFGT